MSTDISAHVPAPDAPEPGTQGTPSGPPPADPGAPVEAVYGAHYYDSYSGGSYEYEGHWFHWFGNLANNIIRQFRPRTVLDAGCAKGFLVQALRERGVEAYGVDASEYAIANAPDSVKPYLWVGSITEPLKDRYDLITCIEVIEHLPATELPAAADVLATATDRLLLSSTSEGAHLAEPSHLSMRAPEDWAALFAGAGMLRDLSEDVTWLTPWAMLLERRPAPTLVETVRTYERQIARNVREVYELRRSTIELEAKLEELHAMGEGKALTRLKELDDEVTQLRADMVAVEARESRAADILTENLRLRDLLIITERDLGQARGEVQSLNDTLRGYLTLADRHHAVVHSTIWQTQWRLLGPYRKLRGRLGR